MSLKIPEKIKSFLRPPAKIVASIIFWVLIFIYYYTRNSDKHHIPSIIVMLSQNEWLVSSIDPKKIKYHIKEPDELPDLLFVWVGEWDREIYDVREHDKYKLVRELLEENKDNSETEYYSYAMKKIKMNDPVIKSAEKLDSEEKVIDYFERQKSIFKDIKNKGYDPSKASEIGVAIARDGSLLHYRQGHHTFAMARILGLKEVKVRVRAVHKEWLLKHIRGRGLNFLRYIREGIQDII
jgi:hypothetical protein